MSWTEERIERLKALHAERLSFSQIARKLGGVTRNAAIGMAHRLGLVSDNKVRAPKVQGGGRPRSPVVKAPPKLTTRDAVAADVARIEADLPVTDDPFGAAGCRWPLGEVGEADFRFCQRPRGKRANGCQSMWCPEHHALGHHVVAGARAKGRAA